ncbi:MAG: aldehyde dehydrogenase family protein [Lachnospiraceae bacterium]|nr:aldehyde dehydrogenase family protein [Lachnospiraceae bacterium]
MNEVDYIASLVERSRKAQKIAEGFSQRKVDELAAAIIYTFSREPLARELAELTVNETKMGRVDSKMGKMMSKMPAVLYEVLDVKTVGIIERIPEKGITKIAKPLGVIAALIPSTNPEATPLFKGVLGLRARNSLIFAPHPKSKKTTGKVVDIMRELLEKNGAPADLFICIDEPSISLSKELMRQCDITMATGSGDMVRSAYSSGKPAYGVGAGNAVIVIDETANLPETAQKIKIGKTGDNATGCSAENSIVIQKNIYDGMLAELKKVGGYLASPEEKAKLQATMWVDGHLSRDIVAKPVLDIAKAAGISIPEDTAFIMVEETGKGKGYPFSGEKLSLVLTVYKYDDFDEAIDTVNTIQRYSGFGHSCGIHSYNKEHIEKLALNTYTTRVIVRQPHGASNAGAWHNGLANTFSLGCGSWGGNIVSENITQKHYFNITWVAEPIDRKPATDAEIYRDLLDNVKLL